MSDELDAIECELGPRLAVHYRRTYGDAPRPAEVWRRLAGRLGPQASAGSSGWLRLQRLVGAVGNVAAALVAVAALGALVVALAVVWRPIAEQRVQPGGGPSPAGLGGTPLATPAPDAAEATLRAYFAAYERGDADAVLALTSPRWRVQQTDEQWWATVAAQRAAGLRLVDARETEASRAQPTAQHAERREFEVTLEIDPPEAQQGGWNQGRNTRFVLLVRQPDGWRLDQMATAPEIGTELDPNQVVVAVHFLVDGREVVQTGTSLGGRVVTVAPWREQPPANLQVEVRWGDDQRATADVVRTEPSAGLVVLRPRGSSPAGLGPAVPLQPGAGVIVLGREQDGRLRQVDGTVAATGLALPDPKAFPPAATPQSGPFVEVRATAWPSLAGGLVLDAARRPAAVVVLVQITGSGAPASSYALPLDEVRRWVVAPVATPEPGAPPSPTVQAQPATTTPH